HVTSTFRRSGSRRRETSERRLAGPLARAAERRPRDPGRVQRPLLLLRATHQLPAATNGGVPPPLRARPRPRRIVALAARNPGTRERCFVRRFATAAPRTCPPCSVHRRCPNLLSLVLRRREPCKRAVRSALVVVLEPFAEDLARVLESVEPVRVQTL